MLSSQKISIIGKILIAAAMATIIIIPMSLTSFAKCKQPPPAYPKVTKDKVYMGLPYKAGESSKFSVYWTKLKAGFLSLNVEQPYENSGNWNQVFSFEASTGEWFRHIYIGRYSGRGLVRPHDKAVMSFRLTVFRDPPFQRQYNEDKWIRFDQQNCEVHETIKVDDKPIKKKTAYVEHGANDALGIFLGLRTFAYQIGKKERVLVYSSEKNWWLEITPEAVETVEVPYGKMQAFKLGLQTYIGKDLQQKGKVHAWVGKDDPLRPLLKIEAEVKIGSVKVLLEELKPGAS